MSKKLWELSKGDVFVIIHEDGTKSDSPWFFFKTDGMYAVCAKRPDATVKELQYIPANADVEVIDEAP